MAMGEDCDEAGHYLGGQWVTDTGKLRQWHLLDHSRRFGGIFHESLTLGHAVNPFSHVHFFTACGLMDDMPTQLWLSWDPVQDEGVYHLGRDICSHCEAEARRRLAGPGTEPVLD